MKKLIGLGIIVVLVILLIRSIDRKESDALIPENVLPEFVGGKIYSCNEIVAAKQNIYYIYNDNHQTYDEWSITIPIIDYKIVFWSTVINNSISVKYDYIVRVMFPNTVISRISEGQLLIEYDRPKLIIENVNDSVISEVGKFPKKYMVNIEKQIKHKLRIPTDSLIRVGKKHYEKLMLNICDSIIKKPIGIKFVEV